MLELLKIQPASNSDLTNQINSNYKHTFVELSRNISGLLTKHEFFFKLDYPRNYWTLDSDYEYEIIHTFDSNHKQEHHEFLDPFKAKYSVCVSNKESGNQLHQYPMIVLLIVMAFQNSHEKLLTLEEISDFVQEYTRHSFVEQGEFDEDNLKERLLKTLRNVIIFQKTQSTNKQYWKLNTDIVLANVQQSIDRQNEANKKFQQQFPFFNQHFDESLIKGHVIITKIMFKILSDSPNKHFTRNQIAELVNLEYQSGATNLPALVYDSLKRNELFKKLDSNKTHLYTLNRSFYENTFKKRLAVTEHVAKFDIYSDDTEIVSNKIQKPNVNVLKACDNILPGPSKLMPKTKEKKSHKNKENSFSFF